MSTYMDVLHSTDHIKHGSYCQTIEVATRQSYSCQILPQTHGCEQTKRRHCLESIIFPTILLFLVSDNKLGMVVF